MVCENPIEQTKERDNSLAPSNSTGQDMIVPDNGVTSYCTSSTQSSASSTTNSNSQESVAEKDVHNPPTSFYNYCYPGYNGSFAPLDDGSNNSDMGVQGDLGSAAYYMPSFNPYAAGTFVGADGQCVTQAYFTTSGYPQTPVTYGAEALPCYKRDASYLGDPSNGQNATSGTSKSDPARTTKVRSNGIKPSKLYGSAIGKLSTVSTNSKSRQSVATSNVSQPKFDTQPLKLLNEAASFANVYHPAGNFQSLPLEKRGPFANNGAMGYGSAYKTSNGNGSLRSNRKSEFEMSNELIRGPRTHNWSNCNSSEKETLGLAVQKNTYNLENFQIEYETAKFYVIKSYSEDDVHRCLKYAVWSSTANGNQKLDAAFHDAEAKASVAGTKCPLFLFFSVNGSGQFVGVAEMMGKVDFNKSMDFWQLNKWSGFFPVKWHIVKDVPNSQLRHIVLENNDNRPVTFTRDTQEIGLKQGLEMLKIFKNYSAKTSLQDDFEFYEDRERALQNRRSSNSGVHQVETYGNRDLSKHLATEAKGESSSTSHVASVSSLVPLTKSLSVNSSCSK